MPYPLPRNILWHGLWPWQMIWWPCWLALSRKQQQVRHQMLREKLKHQGWVIYFKCILWNTLTRQSFLGSFPIYRKRKDKYGMTPIAVPSSVCLGSNGFDSHWIWYLSKLRLQNQLYSLLCLNLPVILKRGFKVSR